MRKRKIIVICICVIGFLAGLGTMLYPMFSQWYTSKYHSEVRTQYHALVDGAEENHEIDAMREAAMEYNRALFAGEVNTAEYETNGYMDLLDPMGNGIMGYIIIPKINVDLPIYHTTDLQILDVGAGHMQQTSLPVGGTNTHAVISAHTGMAESPMFSDLELLEIGDIFQLEVLDDILTYEVYEIEVVEPYEIDSILIQAGQDLCTLVTCTPYGINSHRLLVHGQRIETPETSGEGSETVAVQGQESGESVWMKNYKQSIRIGLLIILIFLVITYLTVRFIRRKDVRSKGAGNET